MLRASSLRSRRQHGLTLIELSVALAVFAVLGLLSWRATAQLADNRDRVGAELGRWREISAAMQRVETELLQVAAPARPANSDAPPALQLLRSGDGHGSELRLLALAPDGAHRSALRYSGQQLEWLVWPDRNGLGAAQAYPLLEGVTAVRWHFAAGGSRRDDWPPAASSPPGELPAAVEIELELGDAGTFRRLFALR